MKFCTKKIVFTLITIFCGALNIHATPSTIIWIPSVDLQPFKVFHLGIDNYFTVFKKGIGQGGLAFPTDLGVTVGVLPFEKFQAEVGVDLLEPTQSPWSFNAKVGIPEGSIAEWSPGIAIGACNLGVEKNLTDYNIIYGIVAKTLPVIGRLSVGYYTGNKNLLVDNDGKVDNSGILVSWDKQVSEINENLWLAVDYQGGKNSLGAVSFGLAWSFSKNISVILARDIYNNNAPSTLTTQLDINL
jgi:hypothetical protein